MVIRVLERNKQGRVAGSSVHQRGGAGKVCQMFHLKEAEREGMTP